MHLIFTQFYEAGMISSSPFCISISPGSSVLNGFSKVAQLEGELGRPSAHSSPWSFGSWNLWLLLNHRWDSPRSLPHHFQFQCVSSAQYGIQKARSKREFMQEHLKPAWELETETAWPNSYTLGMEIASVNNTLLTITDKLSGLGVVVVLGVWGIV